MHKPMSWRRNENYFVFFQSLNNRQTISTQIFVTKYSKQLRMSTPTDKYVLITSCFGLISIIIVHVGMCNAFYQRNWVRKCLWINFSNQHPVAVLFFNPLHTCKAVLNLQLFCAFILKSELKWGWRKKANKLKPTNTLPTAWNAEHVHGTTTSNENRTRKFDFHEEKLI